MEICGRGALANSLGPGLPWHLAVPVLLLPGLAPDFRAGSRQSKRGQTDR